MALRFALGALLHKHRVVLGSPPDYALGALSDSATGFGLLSREISSASYPPAPARVLATLKGLPERLAVMLSEGAVADAAEVAGLAYARIDEVLPGVFDMKTARQITDKLVQPAHFVIGRAMSWSKWQRGDTPRQHEADTKLRELLKQRPSLVKAFGKPHYEDDADGYWRWWEFAVFDGARWHTFHLDDRFAPSLESGSLSDEDGKRREQVAELILAEFERAARALPEA